MQDKFDGMAVELHGGRFSGQFDIEPTEIDRVAMNREVHFLIRARSTGAAIKETKSGDLQRVNTFELSETTLIPNSLGLKLGAVSQAQMSLLDSGEDPTNLVAGLMEDTDID